MLFEFIEGGGWFEELLVLWLLLWVLGWIMLLFVDVCDVCLWFFDEW